MRRLSSLCNWSIGLLAGMLFMYACSTTIDAKGDFETIGASGGFQIKVTPEKVVVQAAPVGNFLDVHARDAQGNPIGSPVTGVGPGDEVPAVPGAASYTFTLSNQTTCTGCTVDNLTTPSGRRPASPHALGGGVQQIMLVIPAVAFTNTTPGFGPLSNAYASFSFQLPAAASADEIWQRVAPIVLAPLGAQPAVASDTTVNFFTKAVPTANGADLFVLDETLGFESFMFKMNDQIIATLGYHSETIAYPNGWRVLKARIKASDIQGDGNEDFLIVADTIESDVNGILGTVTYQPQ